MFLLKAQFLSMISYEIFCENLVFRENYFLWMKNLIPYLMFCVINKNNIFSRKYIIIKQILYSSIITLHIAVVANVNIMNYIHYKIKDFVLYSVNLQANKCNILFQIWSVYCIVFTSLRRKQITQIRFIM